MLSAFDRQLEHRAIWDRKPVLREVYGHLYRKIVAACVPGLTLEVGGGSGNLKRFASDIISCDIVPASWLDLVADAQSLPLAAGSVSNIVMFDVLHHIEYPRRFFTEAQRTLREGGRVVMLEPGITTLSHIVYRLLHEEPVDMSVDPLVEGAPNPGKDPYSGNQATPTLLVRAHAARLAAMYPGLPIARVEWLSLFAYPLSGGFKNWSLITPALARGLLALEDRVANRIRALCAFRVLIVMEKRGDNMRQIA